MDTGNLVRMANRIGDFFEAMPERDEALQDIAQHIRKFWDPRMRQQLLAALDAGEAADLQDIVRSAVEQHRATLG
ncbi:MAG TPA: formate dehydrogenase subunit delta [Pseudorhodoferax sp.]|jgi:formate dehydrogenase subunit delta|nr:formate dehydrogenase subunit delta [Pseudorhodoferax sp.]